VKIDSTCVFVPAGKGFKEIRHIFAPYAQAFAVGAIINTLVAGT
jgi:hypothetical protein